jgi:preprotein translocase subunit YajC
MVEWKKFIVAGIGGLLAAFLWYMIIALAFSTAEIGWLFFVLLIGMGYFLYKRTTRARHAAGWASVLLSIGSFGIPLSTLLWGAGKVAEAGEQGAAYQAGAGIGATIISGVGFFFGFFFGIVFAIVAYFLLKSEGKEKKEGKK